MDAEHSPNCACSKCLRNDKDVIDWNLATPEQKRRMEQDELAGWRAQLEHENIVHFQEPASQPLTPSGGSEEQDDEDDEIPSPPRKSPPVARKRCMTARRSLNMSQFIDDEAIDIDDDEEEQSSESGPEKRLDLLKIWKKFPHIGAEQFAALCRSTANCVMAIHRSNTGIEKRSYKKKK